jgi:hypothetical protein
MASKLPPPPPVHVRAPGARTVPHGALQAKPAGSRPLAPHVQAAFNPAQARLGTGPATRAMAAPHVQAATARIAQPKLAPPREGHRAPHVQAAAGAAAQPRRALEQRARVVPAPPVQARPVPSFPAHPAGGTVQPFCGWLWDKITSCFRSEPDEFQPLFQVEDQQVEVVVQRRSESHLVDQNDYSPLTLNDSYYPGDLTACAMVFVLGAGGGCVYHWPFHQSNGGYLTRMQTAMREAGVAHAVTCQVFGRDYGLTNSKRGEYLESWRVFGDYIQQHLGVAPAISLCEDDYSNPILIYTARGIVSRFPEFTPLATLMG